MLSSAVHKGGKRLLPNTVAASRGLFAASAPRFTWTEIWWEHDPTPKVAQYRPYVCTVESGKVYWWCACGESKTQPWVDGHCKCSKREGGFRPRRWEPEHDGVRLFCGCKSCFSSPTWNGGCFTKWMQSNPAGGMLYCFAAAFGFGTLTSYWFHP
ncbi:conserved hypothetical protein [Perkinsus marinus ATCC 50983]|uniref:Uncharacterized protein n=1 Tax=Perkinsus marinus (strain ATCC 50983 / TXsc) TaxID=423536 RepID=C5KM63_PERM5|nr:conserved hypothetical protein [Perkinsus marinus ATCC 50983]EER14424.1 conserved hypothetical protein [Perkinsus marinus ATCC 50983]|eukprot:XP_002782629.1 conserved hypothetical protein [Perkinsus marinus ATCC 50983]